MRGGTLEAPIHDAGHAYHASLGLTYISTTAAGWIQGLLGRDGRRYSVTITLIALYSRDARGPLCIAAIVFSTRQDAGLLRLATEHFWTLVQREANDVLGKESVQGEHLVRCCGRVTSDMGSECLCMVQTIGKAWMQSAAYALLQRTVSGLADFEGGRAVGPQVGDAIWQCCKYFCLEMRSGNSSAAAELLSRLAMNPSHDQFHTTKACRRAQEKYTDISRSQARGDGTAPVRKKAGAVTVQATELHEAMNPSHDQFHTTKACRRAQEKYTDLLRSQARGDGTAPVRKKAGAVTVQANLLSIIQTWSYDTATTDFLDLHEAMVETAHLLTGEKMVVVRVTHCGADGPVGKLTAETREAPTVPQQSTSIAQHVDAGAKDSHTGTPRPECLNQHADEGDQRKWHAPARIGQLNVWVPKELVSPPSHLGKAAPDEASIGQMCIESIEIAPWWLTKAHGKAPWLSVRLPIMSPSGVFECSRLPPMIRMQLHLCGEYVKKYMVARLPYCACFSLWGWHNYCYAGSLEQSDQVGERSAPDRKFGPHVSGAEKAVDIMKNAWTQELPARAATYIHNNVGIPLEHALVLLCGGGPSSSRLGVFNDQALRYQRRLHGNSVPDRFRRPVQPLAHTRETALPMAVIDLSALPLISEHDFSPKVIREAMVGSAGLVQYCKNKGCSISATTEGGWASCHNAESVEHARLHLLLRHILVLSEAAIRAGGILAADRSTRAAAAEAAVRAVRRRVSWKAVKRALASLLEVDFFRGHFVPLLPGDKWLAGLLNLSSKQAPTRAFSYVLACLGLSLASGIASRTDGLAASPTVFETLRNLHRQCVTLMLKASHGSANDCCAAGRCAFASRAALAFARPSTPSARSSTLRSEVTNAAVACPDAHRCGAALRRTYSHAARPSHARPSPGAPHSPQPLPRREEYEAFLETLWGADRAVSAQARMVGALLLGMNIVACVDDDALDCAGVAMALLDVQKNIWMASKRTQRWYANVLVIIHRDSKLAMQFVDRAVARKVCAIAITSSNPENTQHLRPSALLEPYIVSTTVERTAQEEFQGTLRELAENGCLRAIFLDEPDAYMMHGAFPNYKHMLSVVANLSAMRGIPVAVISAQMTSSLQQDVLIQLQLVRRDTVVVQAHVMENVRHVGLRVHGVRRPCDRHRGSGPHDAPHPMFQQATRLVLDVVAPAQATGTEPGRVVVFCATPSDCNNVFEALTRCSAGELALIPSLVHHALGP